MQMPQPPAANHIQALRSAASNGGLPAQLFIQRGNFTDCLLKIIQHIPLQPPQTRRPAADHPHHHPVRRKLLCRRIINLQQSLQHLIHHLLRVDNVTQRYNIFVPKTVDHNIALLRGNPFAIGLDADDIRHHLLTVIAGIMSHAFNMIFQLTVHPYQQITVAAVNRIRHISRISVNSGEIRLNHRHACQPVLLQQLPHQRRHRTRHLILSISQRRVFQHPQLHQPITNIDRSRGSLRITVAPDQSHQLRFSQALTLIIKLDQQPVMTRRKTEKCIWIYCRHITPLPPHRKPPAPHLRNPNAVSGRFKVFYHPECTCKTEPITQELDIVTVLLNKSFCHETVSRLTSTGSYVRFSGVPNRSL